MVWSKVGNILAGQGRQLSFQLVNLTLQVPVIFCMGNMTLPTRATFGGMSCAHTPLTAFPPFGTPVRLTMLGAPWLCLVWVGIYLMWSCCVAMWTCFLHHERLNRISFKLDQTLPIDGANCKDSICNDPKFVLGSNVKGPNNKFVERGYQRTRLTPKEKWLNLTFIDGLTPI